MSLPRFVPERVAADIRHEGAVATQRARERGAEFETVAVAAVVERQVDGLEVQHVAGIAMIHPLQLAVGDLQPALAEQPVDKHLAIGLVSPRRHRLETGDAETAVLKPLERQLRADDAQTVDAHLTPQQRNPVETDVQFAQLHRRHRPAAGIDTHAGQAHARIQPAPERLELPDPDLMGRLLTEPGLDLRFLVHDRRQPQARDQIDDGQRQEQQRRCDIHQPGHASPQALQQRQPRMQPAPERRPVAVSRLAQAPPGVADSGQYPFHVTSAPRRTVPAGRVARP